MFVYTIKIETGGEMLQGQGEKLGQEFLNYMDLCSMFYLIKNIVCCSCLNRNFLNITLVIDDKVYG